MSKNSKLWLLGGVSLLVLIVAIALPLVGQANEKGWGPRPEGVICHLDARLDLTPEQKEKLVPIVNREMEKRREMVMEHRREMSQMRAEFHEKMEKEKKSTEKELASVLSADQMQEFKKLVDERPQRGPGWKKGPCRGEFRGHRGCW